MPIFENSQFELYFPQYHTNDSSLFIPINLPSNETIEDTKYKYMSIVEPKLLQAEEDGKLINQILPPFLRPKNAERGKELAEKVVKQSLKNLIKDVDLNT